MYLDVQVRLPNNVWARHLVDTVAMWLKYSSTLPFRWIVGYPEYSRLRNGIRYRQVGISSGNQALTRCAFVGTKPSTFVADACLYRGVSGARVHEGFIFEFL